MRNRGTDIACRFPYTPMVRGKGFPDDGLGSRDRGHHHGDHQPGVPRGRTVAHTPGVCRVERTEGRDVLLSGLYFSITGAVCYSRQIDEILRNLVAKGILVFSGRDTLVVRDSAVEEVRVRLRKKLPSAAYRSLQTVSRRFYGKIFPGR